MPDVRKLNDDYHVIVDPEAVQPKQSRLSAVLLKKSLFSAHNTNPFQYNKITTDFVFQKLSARNYDIAQSKSGQPKMEYHYQGVAIFKKSNKNNAIIVLSAHM